PVAYLAQSNTTCPVEWFEMFILKNRELLTNPSDVVTIMIHWSWVTRPAAHAPNPERPSRADTTSPRYRDRRRQLRHHRPPRRARGATAHGRAAAGQRERGHLHDLAGPHRAGLGQHDQRVLPRPSRRLPVLRHPAPGLRGDTGRHDGVGALLDVGMGGRPGLVRRNDQRPDVAPTTRPSRLPADLALQQTLRYCQPPTLLRELATAGAHFQPDLACMFRGDYGYLDKAVDNVAARGRSARHLMTTRPTDLTMVVITEPDRVGHHYWHFGDPEHPDHESPPPGSGWDEAMTRIYRAVDDA